MPWFSDFGWIGALISALFWIALIVVAVWFLQKELPNFRPRTRLPALDLLEERYARGEIDRQEFLERRAVLLGTPASPETPTLAEPPPKPPGGVELPPGPGSSSLPEAEPTEQLPREGP